jgi:thioester reductase-like protein
VSVIAITGFPASFLAVRITQRALLDSPEHRIRCIVRSRFIDRARAMLTDLGVEGAEDRVTLLEGDSAAMDLGLSGAEFAALAREVDVIHHCAAVTYLGTEKKAARRTNIGGAREVLELATAADHLERLVHWSTALVSGKRSGYVLESEASDVAGFRNHVEESRYRAERLIREAASRIPTTVLRPADVVGDSRTGEIDRFEGVYLLLMLMLNSPPDLRLPIPGRGDVPLNLVPIDYVVEAGYAIAKNASTVGKTFHLVDPDPLTARKVFELMATAAGRPLPRAFVPTNLATAILRTPGVDRFSHVPRAFLQQLSTEVVYDDRNTRAALAGTGIECPAFEAYVDVLVRYVRERREERRSTRPTESGEHPAHDPLA